MSIAIPNGTKKNSRWLANKSVIWNWVGPVDVQRVARQANVVVHDEAE